MANGKSIGGALPGESEILTTTCYHNCGGRCILRAEVRDGKILRLLPDQDPVDTLDSPRAIPCQRGRSLLRWVYSPERLQYPMRRIGKRGEGKFERITWDEALDTIAAEMQRIKAQYGNEAFYCNYATGQIAGGIDRNYKAGPLHRLMNIFGGNITFYGSYSSACYDAAKPYITGAAGAGGNSMDDVLHSKLVVLFGDNPMVTMAGGKGGGYHYLQARDAGVKFIVIDPRMTDSVVALNAEWIPIYPGTDVALIAGMAYVMIDEDLYDEAFVEKYTIGFDESNLPEGAPANSSWLAYVMGGADGVPKTPGWASEITGIPAERIVRLAREVAAVKPVKFLQGLGAQRRAYGEQIVRAVPVLSAMTGNFGIAGGGPGLNIDYGSGIELGAFPIGENPVKTQISSFTWPDFIARGEEMTSGPRDRIKGADQLSTSMKFMWNWGGNCLVNQHSDSNATSELLQDEGKLEFLAVVDVMMTPSARFADILLPETTGFECENIHVGIGEGRMDFAVFAHQLIEPLYECRDGLMICEQLADRLGIGDEFRDGHATREDWLREMVAATRKNHPNFPAYEQFKEQGVWKMAGGGGWVRHAAFIDDPDANPLDTETGKIEIYSPYLAAQDDPAEIPAIPKYIPEWEGVSDPLRKTYPLLLIGAHAVQRTHSTLDNVDFLREAHPQMVTINPLDAAERGICDGDLVRVFNARGVVQLPAKVSVRIRPGVVNIPQGAWYTPDENGVDVRGCVNTLTKYHPTPLAKGNPQHTNLVQVAKA